MSSLQGESKASGAGGHGLPATMTAATHRTYGGPEVVAVEVLPIPTPGPGEVLVQVAAAGVDRATLHLLTGLPYLARVAFGVRRPRQPVMGQQVAGRVVAKGDGEMPLAVGDRVFGIASGSFAQFAVAKAAEVAPTPAAVSDVAAATVGISGMTALDAVVVHGQVQAGQRVLVLGGSGAVGSYAVQLAAHLGAEVTAVCSGPKLTFVRDLGARTAVDYQGASMSDMGGPFDVIIDIAGNRSVSRLRSALTPEGALIIVGGEQGGALLGGIQRNLVATAVSPFTRQRLAGLFSRTTAVGCVQLGSLIAQGAVRPAIDRQVGLEDAATALTAMQRGELRGQAVVRP